MKIYTARGDQGQTDLLGERVAKDDPRIELIGTLDETTSAIGFARSVATVDGTNDHLLTVQRDLYQIMAELAFIDTTRPDTLSFSADRVTWLEETIAQLESRITLPREFIITGDTMPGAAMDVARTVVRRAERHAVSLANADVVHNGEIVRYLNRLSSLLFMTARGEDLAAGEAVRLAKGE